MTQGLQASLSVVLATLITIASGGANAAYKEDFGAYVLHYNAFVSTFLTPKIAKQYKLQRSKNIGVLTLSIIKKPNQTVSSMIQGTVTNNIQQTQLLNFKQIVEGKSVYYLAQLPFSEGEVLTFKISFVPEGSRKELKTQFQQNIFN